MKTTLWRRLLAGVKVGGKSGAILGMVLVIVVALSLVGIGLLQLGQMNAVEVSRSYNLSKAFWAAEAGIFHAKAMLRGSQSFRDMLYDLPVSNPQSEYRVATTSEGNGVYTLRSTGTVVSASRVVWQSVFAGEAPPQAFNYALFGGSGELNLRRSSVIDGDVFQNGPIDVNPPVTMTNGTVSATDTNAISPSSLPIVETPDPLPAFPAFDPGPGGAGYDGLITTASSPGPGVTNNVSFPLDLQGKTNYLNMANLQIDGNIIGSGTLVVRGDVQLNSVSLVNNVHIILGGQLTLNCNPCIAGTNCLIYSRGNVETKAGSGGGAVAADTIGTVTLITSGDVGGGSGGLEKNLTVTGVVYAAGIIASKKDITVVGSMLASNGIDIAKNFSLTYSNLWPVPLLPGFSPEMIVTNILWQEKFQ